MGSKRLRNLNFIYITSSAGGRNSGIPFSTVQITPSLSLWKRGADIPTHYSTTPDVPVAFLRSSKKPEGHHAKFEGMRGE